MSANAVYIYNSYSKIEQKIRVDDYDLITVKRSPQKNRSPARGITASKFWPHRYKRFRTRTSAYPSSSRIFGCENDRFNECFDIGLS